VSEQTFGQQVLLRPKDLAALVPASNRLLRDAADTPDLEQVIRGDIAEVLALREDLSYLRGVAAAGEPLGIRNTAGLTPAPNLGANGRTPTFDDLKDMVAALRTVNAPFNRPGWAFNGRLLNTLEKVKDNTGRYLADAGLLTFDDTGAGGTLLGYRFRTSSQIPTNVVTGTSADTTEVYLPRSRPVVRTSPRG
jgi:HK97 family phage major capsid protein